MTNFNLILCFTFSSLIMLLLCVVSAADHSVPGGGCSDPSDAVTVAAACLGRTTYKIMFSSRWFKLSILYFILCYYRRRLRIVPRPRYCEYSESEFVVIYMYVCIGLQYMCMVDVGVYVCRPMCVWWMRVCMCVGLCVYGGCGCVCVLVCGSVSVSSMIKRKPLIGMT